MDESKICGIRPARPADATALARIARAGFPGGLRWRSPRSLAAAYWNSVLSSGACEVWVAEVRMLPGEAAEVAGFSVLVTDEALWSRQRASREGPVVARLWAALRYPHLLVRHISRRRRFRGRRERGAPVVVEPGRRVWLELVAVDPRHRGRGLARALLSHAEGRARNLDRSAVALRVEPDNAPARALYERRGYVFTGEAGGGCRYTKLLQFVPTASPGERSSS